MVGYFCAIEGVNDSGRPKMSSKWTTLSFPGSDAAAAPGTLAQEFVVLLLYGKNSFGDKIYSYVKIHLPNLQKLKSAIQSGKGFAPSDFGEVIAAGKGDPSAATRNEISAQYKVIDSRQPSAAPQSAPPAEKKSWDEY